MPFTNSVQRINFVDIPGIPEVTEGGDQSQLQKLIEEIKAQKLRIDLFILCFDKGKYDKSIQTVMKAYLRLLDDK